MSESASYSLAMFLDEKRLKMVRGTPLEDKVIDMFGGAIKALILEVPFELGKKIVMEFPSARIDARGFLEEVPVVFRRAVFEEIVRLKSIGVEVVDSVLKRMSEIKVAAANEQEYLPPPEV